MSRPFLIALQFLTALPIRLADPPDAEATGRSLLYYPLVGLALGALLTGLAWLLGGAPPLVAAALLLAVWVAVTGALHLDGLADSADAWLGGLGDRERTLAIMKDPYCGPAGVVTLVLALLLKFAALVYLAPNGDWEILVMTPVLGRTAPVLLFLTTPYVRPHGLGSLIANHLPRRACIVIVIFSLAAVPLIAGPASITLLLAMAGVFVVLRRLMLQRLGGTTGDTAGALIEVTEATVLLAAALMG
jgi:adenosylcobinamide-GDP ribazoletransferase